MKVGLALSGGGFRAALFHVGVLARLAELHLLQHVEVLSTVSGGSIVGGLYYVRLKRLLESKPDAEIGPEHYIRLVRTLEGEFLRAVQTNVRMRTFLDPLKNLKMTRADYSRTDRLGEVLDEVLYRPAAQPPGGGRVQMRHLKIFPPDGPEGFHPRRHNAARRAKVPILLINATLLNTGHNWRFEASRMGSPPRRSQTAREIDKNRRLLQPDSYEAITPRQQDMELGFAVAASACVPVVFHPLAVSGLYPDVRLQLMDGGVHDNQGIQGLLDEGCTHLVVSDASGQLADLDDPATRFFAVGSRSNDVLMDRIREEQLFTLLERQPRPVALVHLRKGVPVTSVPWIGPDGTPVPAPPEPGPARLSTEFGVDPAVQDLLSRMRTDLDSFTEVEAFSLMLDGYLMAGPVVAETEGLRDLVPVEPQPSGEWKFLAIGPWLADPREPYLRQLRVAQCRLFEVFRLSVPTSVVTAAVAVALLGGLAWWQWPALVAWWTTPLTVGQLVTTALVFALGLIPWLSGFVTWLRVLRWPVEYALRLVFRGVLPALGSIVVWLHLDIYDPLFLSLGRLDRLRRS